MLNGSHILTSFNDKVCLSQIINKTFEEQFQFWTIEKLLTTAYNFIEDEKNIPEPAESSNNNKPRV